MYTHAATCNMQFESALGNNIEWSKGGVQPAIPNVFVQCKEVQEWGLQMCASQPRSGPKTATNTDSLPFIFSRNNQWMYRTNTHAYVGRCHRIREGRNQLRVFAAVDFVGNHISMVPLSCGTPYVSIFRNHTGPHRTTEYSLFWAELISSWSSYIQTSCTHLQ